MIDPKLIENWDIVFALQHKGCVYHASYEAQTWDPRLCDGEFDYAFWTLVTPCPEGCTSSPPEQLPTNPPPCDPDYNGTPVADIVGCCEGIVQVECTGSCCLCGGVTCEPTETCCGDVCVDLTTDHDHCGGCEIACEPSETCCPCPPEQCDSVINWTWNISPDCPPTPENPYPQGGYWTTQDDCPAGCTGKFTPSDPMDVCGPGSVEQQQCVCSQGSCVDTTSDNNNCGSCNFVCDIGFTCCDGVCKELFGDDILNCGECGNACPGGQICKNGVCKPACAANECTWVWDEDVGPDPCDTADCGVQNWKWTYGTVLTGGNIYSGGSWALVSDCNPDGADYICTGTNAPPSGPVLGSCNGAFDAFFNWLCNDPNKVPGVDCQNSGPHEISGTGSCFDVDCNCEPAPPDCTNTCIWFCSFQPPYNGWFLSSGCESGCQCDEPEAPCIQGGQYDNSEEPTVCYQAPTLRALAGTWVVTSTCPQGCNCPENAPVADGTVNGQVVSYECVDCFPPCGDGQTCCDGVCKNLSNDPNNCGACGNVCAAGVGEFVGCCSGVCTNVSTDSLNCGGCGNQCPLGQTCVNGVCSICNPPCVPPDVCCPSGLSGYCADLSSDNNNCGGCGTVCPPGYSCVDGTCIPCDPPCTEPGTACCSNQCIDIWSDESNCGACNVFCGETCCQGSCVDTQNDPENCGNCGNVCGEGETCCFGQCVNLDSDPNNCGSCGNICLDPPNDTFTVPKCSGGQCAEPLCECQGFQVGMPPTPGPNDVAFVATCVGNTQTCSGSCYFDAVDGAWVLHDEGGTAFSGACGKSPPITDCVDDRLSCVDDKLACVGDIYYCVSDL